MEVNIFDVKGDKRCAFPREDAIENGFAEVKGSGLGANVAKVHDVLAGDSDVSVVGVGLLRPDVVHDL